MISAQPCWHNLVQHQQVLKNISLKQLFADCPNRFSQYHITAGGLLLDFSKNHLTHESLDLLMQLTRQVGLEQQITDMFSGQKINQTEQRAVLHTALRSPHTALSIDDQPIDKLISTQLNKMANLVNKIQTQQWLGFTNKPIQSVVNIGIGGSDLGPRMVCHALAPYHHTGITCYFVSNVDSTDLATVLAKLDPETTLFIVASKSFTTQETLMNAESARDWLLETAKMREAIRQHFIAISSQPERAKKFGIDADNVFEMWDWVGGRYSLWSTIGLPIALATSMETFKALLAGAHEMDQHFRDTPFHQNMPVILALLGIWYHNFWGTDSHAVIPYDQSLAYLPNYLQQLDMESNGKRVDRTGRPVDYQTGPIIWGSVGTNGQHAFHQLLHQGTETVPVDFIIAKQTHYPIADHHAALYANCLAQSQALMLGKDIEQARKECLDQGYSTEAATALAPHKVIPGNKPSNTILIDKLTPQTLGALIALYEHKVFVQSAIWNINAFDQWGVELGKQLGKPILSQILSGQSNKQMDSSTLAMIQALRWCRHKFIATANQA